MTSFSNFAYFRHAIHRGARISGGARRTAPFPIILYTQSSNSEAFSGVREREARQREIGRKITEMVVRSSSRNSARTFPDDRPIAEARTANYSPRKRKSVRRECRPSLMRSGEEDREENTRFPNKDNNPFSFRAFHECREPYASTSRSSSRATLPTSPLLYDDHLGTLSNLAYP